MGVFELALDLKSVPNSCSAPVCKLLHLLIIRIVLQTALEQMTDYVMHGFYYLPTPQLSHQRVNVLWRN